jgi:chromosome segregation ATPase
LDKLAQRAGQYRADREQLEQFDNQLTVLDGQIAQLRRQIGGPFGIATDQIESLPVPLTPAVQQFAREFSDAINAVRQAEREQKQVDREMARVKNELLQLDTRQHVPDRSALTRQRVRRDDGWHLIRQTYIEEQSSEDDVKAWLGEASASLPDQYQHEVFEADRLADDRQEKAELVARRDQIGAEVARLEQRLAETRQQQDDCQATLGRLDQSWRELWAACQLSPQSPET